MKHGHVALPAGCPTKSAADGGIECGPQGTQKPELTRAQGRRQGRRRDHQVLIRSARAEGARLRPGTAQPDRPAPAHSDR